MGRKPAVEAEPPQIAVSEIVMVMSKELEKYKLMLKDIEVFLESGTVPEETKVDLKKTLELYTYQGFKIRIMDLIQKKMEFKE